VRRQIAAIRLAEGKFRTSPRFGAPDREALLGDNCDAEIGNPGRKYTTAISSISRFHRVICQALCVMLRSDELSQRRFSSVPEC
jgi:hypothetical protein